jgi:alpha-tubulin suppressor-like RCC1 family protein
MPKEINDLSKKKPIFVSAGESHSAAITEKLKLFTWGNGAFGRLGHGLDNNEKRPKLVDFTLCALQGKAMFMDLARVNMGS